MSSLSHRTLLDCVSLFRSDATIPPQLNYVCDEGDIRFYIDNLDLPSQDKSTLLIHYVCVKNPRQGTFSKLIRTLQEDEGIQRIGILGVGTNEMVACLTKLGGFKDRGGDFFVVKKNKSKKRRSGGHRKKRYRLEDLTIGLW